MESRQDLEIKLLKSQVSDLTDLLGYYQNEYLGPQATVMAANKVIELSKRNRHLTAEWETLRTKCNCYNKRCLELEAKLQAMALERSQEPAPEVSESELVRMAEELKETKTKLFEALNMNTSLRNDLKLAHKCLEQEIGQPISLKSLTDSKWRGRSQTILALQQKVADLEGKTGSVQQIRSVCSLRKFDEFEHYKKEVENLRHLCDEQKFKLAAHKSRNQILAEDAAKSKQKCAELLDQVQSDRRKIDALNLQIECLSFEKESNTVAPEVKDTVDEEYRRQIEDARKEAASKEKIIEKLNTRILELEENVKNLAGDFLFRCRDMKKEQFLAMIEALEQQNEALTHKLADEVKRLDDERGKQKKQTELLARRKTRINQLEAKIKELELSAPITQKKDISSRLSMSSQVSPVGSKHKFPAPPNSRASNETLPSCVEIQELKYKLEYTNEQIRLLEQTSKELMAEKENFCQYFCDVISKTREIFLNSFNEVNARILVQ